MTKSKKNTREFIIITTCWSRREADQPGVTWDGESLRGRTFQQCFNFLKDRVENRVRRHKCKRDSELSGLKRLDSGGVANRCTTNLRLNLKGYLRCTTRAESGCGRIVPISLEDEAKTGERKCGNIQSVVRHGFETPGCACSGGQG